MPSIVPSTEQYHPNQHSLFLRLPLEILARIHGLAGSSALPLVCHRTLAASQVASIDDKITYLWQQVAPVLIQPPLFRPSPHPFAGMEFCWRAGLIRMTPSLWALPSDVGSTVPDGTKKSTSDLNTTHGLALNKCLRYKFSTAEIIKHVDAYYQKLKVQEKIPVFAPRIALPKRLFDPVSLRERKLIEHLTTTYICTPNLEHLRAGPLPAPLVGYAAIRMA